ncbi:potassium transporter [Mycena pura]|uniref:Potassium transporter n=1 Tax=Mycena pura TaxID=153505 RepID=A0AAD6UPB0_9AGAR|nr:potassium transporter [Mycena pura]
MEPHDAAPKRIFKRVSDFVWTHGTFYRLHFTLFTIVPLIAAGVFYGCNGRFRVSFLDSVFLCYSAMTVTGLSTINLSTTTAWQQTILYLLMLVGDFTNVCRYVHYRACRRPKRSRPILVKSISSPIAVFKQRQEVPMSDKASGNTTFGPTTSVGADTGDPKEQPERVSEDHAHVPFDAPITFSSSPRPASVLLSPTRTQSPRSVNFAMATSIEPPLRLQTIHGGLLSLRAAFPRKTATIYNSNRKAEPGDKKFHGKGGFPGPLTVAKRLLKRGAPSTFRTLERKLSMPYTETLEAKDVPWLSFDGLVVGRNSAFRTESLSDEQLEVIGGVEYRALRLLSYLIPIYFISTQLFAFILFAPWLSATKQYDAVFTAQPRLVKKPWFSLFLVFSSYSGTGLSLVDVGMVPFQSAYLMIFALGFLILAGNHALPPNMVFGYLSRVIQVRDLPFFCTLSNLCEVLSNGLRSKFSVYIGLPFYEAMSKGPRIVDGLFQGLAARASGLAIIPLAESSPALQFLYIVMMYIAVRCDDDPLDQCVCLTLFRRCWRTDETRRYESESLGVFEEPPDEAHEEPTNLDTFGPRERVGRYLLWHLDRQMSIDIWWLVWGVFLVAVIERHNLLDPEKRWFDMFRVVFELVSAFGGIGLSLGLPTDNFSFSGALRPLSKVVVIVIMLRGRHRGLPMGVERAVTLPRELKTDRAPAGATTNGAGVAPTSV